MRTVADQEADQESASNSRLVVIGLVAAGAVAIGLGVLLLREFGVDGVLGLGTEAWERLKSAPPIVFFGTMALLTIFPVPLSPFYIVAGPLFGVVHSLMWIPPAIVMNNLIAYTLTTSFLRPRLQKLVSKRGFSIPTLRSKGDQNLFIAMVRIAPGPPYFIQSLVLGLAGVDRVRFLVISLAVHMIYAVGFVVLGRSAFNGEYGVAIGAVALIVVATVCARFAHQRLTQNSD
jgi:uncharacterized membrane protein YdjX (TVP38/TMEM64 family)